LNHSGVSLGDSVVFRGAKVSQFDDLSLSIGDSIPFTINPTNKVQFKILNDWKKTKAYRGDQTRLSSIRI
jgi:hypothetical protein